MTVPSNAVPAREPGRTRLPSTGWYWASFQAGRDPYIVLITVYVFAPYFVTTVVGNVVLGQELIASGAKYAGWVVAISAPVLGAVVDRLGPRKPWLGLTVAIMALLMTMLWWAKPGGAGLDVGTVVAILATLAVLCAYTETLHNALLVAAVGLRHAGTASGLALALGNVVSVVMLVLVLWAFAMPGTVEWSILPAAPLFGLDPATHEPDRIVPVIVAITLVIGSLPLLLFAPDMPRQERGLWRAIRLGIADLAQIVRDARSHRDAFVYLAARMLFTDGVTGILIFTGVYAAGAMGWQTTELLAYGLILCVFGISGGLLAGWLDTRIGPKRALTVEIAGAVMSQILILGNARDTLFYAPFAASHAAVWQGPIFRTAPEIALIVSSIFGAITVTASSASSRTLLTRVIDPSRAGSFFGLFVIAGSATMWLAPLLVQVATSASGSQRIGLLPIAGLLLAGLIVLQAVRERALPPSD